MTLIRLVLKAVNLRVALVGKGDAGTAEKVENVYNVYILSKGYACIENVC